MSTQEPNRYSRRRLIGLGFMGTLIYATPIVASYRAPASPTQAFAIKPTAEPARAVQPIPTLIEKVTFDQNGYIEPRTQLFNEKGELIVDYKKIQTYVQIIARDFVGIRIETGEIPIHSKSQKEKDLVRLLSEQVNLVGGETYASHRKRLSGKAQFVELEKDTVGIDIENKRVLVNTQSKIFDRKGIQEFPVFAERNPNAFQALTLASLLYRAFPGLTELFLEKL